MESKELKRCRDYESCEGEKIQQNEKPPFHLTPKIGWMNDPNGFVFYNNEFHLFYQYNPYDTVWGPMHWGHAVSKDLVQWSYLPAALAPDSDSDREGCFSGCAIQNKEGKLSLVYTGVKKVSENACVQIQCLAEGDGKEFEKYPSNPVIGSEKLPAGCMETDFRDPKIIKSDDGSYILYAVNKNSSKKGQVLVYKSNDLKDWEFCSVLLKNDFDIGKMWECPDVFALGQKDILMVSVQEVSQTDFFDSGNIAICITGKYDYESHSFNKENVFQIDRGLDFYAPQTVLTDDGRRIMIGWLQNWDICNYKTEGSKWYGQMSIPREIWMEGEVFYQKPVRELEKYRDCKTEYDSIKINDNKVALNGIKGNCLDITICVKEHDADLFCINLFERNENRVRVYYDFNLCRTGIDRSRAGSSKALLHERSCKYLLNEGEELKVRIIVDRNSVEVFFGKGELALSMSIYEDTLNEGVSFESKGMSVIDVESYSLKNF
ncbi:MAG: glycoside hydrolase family 32 protein [Treponema sp.]|nr:glycoside hydrolase family 32 protein [Treponema sp.]